MGLLGLGSVNHQKVHRNQADRAGPGSSGQSHSGPAKGPLILRSTGLQSWVRASRRAGGEGSMERCGVGGRSLWLGRSSCADHCVPPLPQPRSRCCGAWCLRSPQPQLMGPQMLPMTEACRSTGQCPKCWSRMCPTLSSSPQSWKLVLPLPSHPCSPARCPAREGPGAGDPTLKVLVICERTGLTSLLTTT